MTTAQRVWISNDAYGRLQEELAVLRQLVATAADDGDTDENATAIQRARHKRIQQIHDLLDALLQSRGSFLDFSHQLESIRLGAAGPAMTTG